MDDVSSSSSSTSISGGINLDAGRDITIGGDVVGRDKITVGYTSEQVSAILTQISTQFQPKPFDGRCPYKGLDVFEEEDAEFFFGRERLIEDLISRVNQSRAVFITGPSGSGKSSLVRAGLIHALKHEAIAGSEHWLYEALKPGRSPLDELARVASSLAGALNAGEDIRTKGPYDATILQQWIEVALKDRHDRRAVIFVDQFEEVFTQVVKEDVRIAFLNLLTHAVTVDSGRAIVLFAMRSDFVSNCATYPQVNALLNQQFLQVGAMLPNELVSAIAEPALRVGLKIDPDLVAQIINEMEGEPGALPLMQFALKDLFDSQQAKGRVSALTLPDYLARGGIHKALERHADAAFAQFGEEEQQITRQVFGGLIQVGRGTQDTRRTALFDELVSAGVDKTQVEVVVQKLADARLITTDVSDGKDTVTISHEKLIDAWPWLRKLVNENREAIALQNQLAEDAQEWDHNGRDASYLYVGARLANAREQLATKKIVLSGLAYAFVTAGVEAEEADRLREAARLQKELDDARRLAESEKQRAEDQAESAARLRRGAMYLIGALGIALLLGIAAGTFGIQSNQAANANATLAVQNASNASTAQAASTRAVAESSTRTVAEAEAVKQRDEAQRQQHVALAALSRQLAAQALNQINLDPELGLLIVREAVETADTFEAQDALRELLAASHVRAVWRGHDAGVRSAQFSPDGKYVVTAGCDKSASGICRAGTARVWNAATAQEAAVLQGHAGWVNNARFSPDGQQIVTASEDGTARVWEAATGQEVAVLRGHKQSVNSAQFSPDGKTIVTTSDDATARVWGAASGQEILILGGAELEATSAAFSPDGRQIITVGAGTARVWEAATGKAVVVLRGPEYGIDSAQFSPDGKTIVVAGCDRFGSGYCTDGTVRVWDAATGQEIAVLSGHENRIHSMQFSTDGKTIVTASFDGTARVWDFVPGRQLAILRETGYTVLDAQFSPDGQYVVTAGCEKFEFGTCAAGTARVWERAGRPVAVLRGHKNVVVTAQFSPEGEQIVTASDDGTARLWQVVTGKPLVVLRGHTESILSVQFSPDGRYLVTASSDHTARVWEATTGKEVVVLRGHEDLVSGAQFSPDGQRIVTASRDATARVWEVATGKEVAVLRGHSKWVNNAEFSADGQQIVTASDDGTVRLWEAATGEEMAALSGHSAGVNNAQFSFDGNYIVTAECDQFESNYCATGTARIWEVTTGREVIALRGLAGGVNSAQFSLDGQYIVTAGCADLKPEGCKAGIARVWEAATGREVIALPRHEYTVRRAAFSPDGQQIVTASLDDVARVWKVATGRQVDALHEGNKYAVNDVQFSPDGKYLVTASTDGNARVYLARLQDLIALTNARVTRELTCVERIQYLQEEIVCPTPTPTPTP